MFLYHIPCLLSALVMNSIAQAPSLPLLTLPCCPEAAGWKLPRIIHRQVLSRLPFSILPSQWKRKSLLLSHAKPLKCEQDLNLVASKGLTGFLGLMFYNYFFSFTHTHILTCLIHCQVLSGMSSMREALIKETKEINKKQRPKYIPPFLDLFLFIQVRILVLPQNKQNVITHAHDHSCEGKLPESTYRQFLWSGVHI